MVANLRAELASDWYSRQLQSAEAEAEDSMATDLRREVDASGSRIIADLFEDLHHAESDSELRAELQSRLAGDQEEQHNL